MIEIRSNDQLANSSLGCNKLWENQFQRRNCQIKLAQGVKLTNLNLGMMKETVENQDLLKEKEPERVLVTETGAEGDAGPEKRTGGGQGQGQEGGEERHHL